MEGGSANDYDYAHADPINCGDLTGTEDHRNYPDPASLSCEELLRWIKDASKDIKVRNDAFTRNKNGLDYSDFDYKTHVSKFNERKAWLFDALAELEDRCPELAAAHNLSGYYKAAASPIKRLGHPGVPAVANDFLSGHLGSRAGAALDLIRAF